MRIEGDMIIRSRSVLFALLLTTPFVLRAQTADQWTGWGDAAEARGDHYGASLFYRNALMQEPGHMQLQWSMAEACRLSNQYPQAAEFYEKVTKKDMGREHPEAFRWLAEMQMCMGSYEEARRTWAKVKQKEKDNSSFTELRANNGITGCELAMELMQMPEEVNIEHLPAGVNTYDSEFGGRIGPDSALWFSSLRGKANDEGEVQDTSTYHVSIYRSPVQAASFGQAEHIHAPPIFTGDNANAAWNTAGDRFLFTRCTAAGPCTIHWSLGADAQPLDGIGIGLSSTQPMVAVVEGSLKLFFTSDRPGGEGGMDIWVADYDDNHTVTDLRPLGPPVNTPGNETCPFYDVVQRKLYFSSDFLPGFGGYDNFMSKDSAGGFTAPENFKYPLNSPANDLYPTFDMRTMSGLFTSNRVGSLAAKGETCCNDLYRFSYGKPAVIPPPVDTATVVALKHITSLREKLPVRLYFHNDEPEPRSWDTLTAQTYEQTYRTYKALVPDYHKAWGDNTQGISAIDGFFRTEVDGGFNQLNEFIVLLKQAMDEGQRIKLVVRGFASPLAKSDYNVNLSLRRIQSMINYLRAVEGGAFKPYLEGTAANGGRLTIEKAPYGENRAVEGVSDVLEDLRNSVYSVNASLERRIEIEQVELMDAPTGMAHPALDRSAVDFGTIERGNAQRAEFQLYNNGALPLHILSKNADCGCTYATMDESPLQPGATRTIQVDFNGHASEGPLMRKVTLVTDGDPSTLTLTITGTIVVPK